MLEADQFLLLVSTSPITLLYHSGYKQMTQLHLQFGTISEEAHALANQNCQTKDSSKVKVKTPCTRNCQLEKRKKK